MSPILPNKPTSLKTPKAQKPYESLRPLPVDTLNCLTSGPTPCLASGCSGFSCMVGSHLKPLGPRSQHLMFFAEDDVAVLSNVTELLCNSRP